MALYVILITVSISLVMLKDRRVENPKTVKSLILYQKGQTRKSNSGKQSQSWLNLLSPKVQFIEFDFQKATTYFNFFTLLS